ncbi:MAG: hypothetical protein A3H27_08540 [Acidobacteria bacterium RIFCSPLOWO2_02_FULL_59_13]|nr:MAG: hypothetical protein A3H27_08540 [Acidobacteria bacterium RIFCSPLOWO2_02_FULL_59_13]
MNCPACGNTLTPITVESLTVDACQGGCGGIWFDRSELPKVDESNESAGEKLLEIPRKPSTPLDPNKRFFCPRCGTIMMRHFSSVKRHVLVDHCPKCAGTWLDAGELAAIRSEFSSQEERKKAAEAYFGEIFGTHLTAMRAQGEPSAQQASAVTRIFQLLGSGYFPGRQW